MARFRKRSGSWTAEIRRKGYAPIARTFDTKAEAERWASTVEGKMLSGRYVDTREAEATTLREALARYGREVTPGKKGAAREAKRLRMWSADPLSSRSLASLRGSDFAAWRDARLAGGAKSNTVRLDLALVSHLFTIAVKEWCLPLENPLAKIRKPPAGLGRDVRLPAHAESRVIAEAVAISAELPAWIILAIETGMRRGEMESARREWISGPVLKLPTTKNGTARDVPLSSRALAAIAALPVRMDGRLLGLSGEWVGRLFARVAEAAGCPEVRFHDLRHEATSRFFERGLNPMEVAAITGHKTLAMLKRYTHLKAEDLARRLG
jgi:integrase